MKRSFLALALMMGGAASTATADYVVIIANLGRATSARDQAGRPGQPGGGPAAPGQPVVPPAGAPPNVAPGFAARPGAPVPNAAAPAGPGTGPFDPDNIPLMIVAVIEVEKKVGKQDLTLLALGRPIRSPFKHAGLEGSIFLANTRITNVVVLHPNGKPTPPLADVYAAKLKALVESKTPVTAEEWVNLAEWCLGHGMLDQFKKHMDKAAEVDKNYPQVSGYVQMKASLAKPLDPKEKKSDLNKAVDETDAAGAWRKQLLSSRYETTKSPHYVLLSNDRTAAESRLRRLEDDFQSYYYWFALHGVQLPVPAQRLIAVLTNDPKTFNHLHTVLDSTPVVSDAFYARRENIAVFSSKRLDDAYDRLEKLASPLWGQGFSRDDLLKGKGYPPRLAQTAPQEIYDAMTLALLLKVMELDAEVAGTMLAGTRQFLYATGFLPPSVVAPEWVQFGVSSFFMTTPGSPWPTFGLPSFGFGPLFKDLVAARKLPSDQLELLKRTVTDDFFRNPAEGLKKDAAQRRARATAWSLTHFLIRKRLDGLQRYFKELSQMPRDLALDENTLWLAFARAFNAVDATGQPDANVLRELADDWDKDMKIDQYDNREIDLMRMIRLAYQAAAVIQDGPAVPNQPGAPGAPGAPAGRQGNPAILRRGVPGG